MNKYQSFKSSGVEWVGKIPEQWISSKLKFVLDRIVTGGTPDTSNDSYWSDDEDGVNWISISDMTSNPKGIESTKKKITQRGLENKRLELLSIDTLIYSIYGSIGKVNRLKSESTIHQGILGLFPNSKINSKFLEYYLKYIQDFVSILSSSNTQENLNLEKVKNIGIVLPLLSEQSQIVQFLDEKTELIDKLISTKERKITLLKEQRTSLINQVVTKGLNPNVKMKDSGVEWIGEIPEHWDMLRVSNFGFFFKGNGIKKDEVKEEGFPCIRYGEIYTKYDRIVYTPTSFIDYETSKNSVQIKKGDILFTGSGETVEDIGKSLLYFGEENIFVGGDIIVLRLNEGNNPIYLSYLLNSRFIQYQKSLMGRGEIIVHIYSKNIKEIKTPLPSKNEQDEIVNYLDTQTKEIDGLVSLEQRKIDTLKEYRQSLISEVVTGKIKVTTD